MKQTGKTWLTPEGHETLAKYLPAHIRLFEKIGQKIAAEATTLEQSLRDAKLSFVEMCKEALRNNPDKGAQRRFTFYTFDKEFKIEFDIKEEYVRVYRALKKNPTSKDYEMISMDFNKTDYVFNKAIEETLQTLEMTPENEQAIEVPQAIEAEVTPVAYPNIEEDLATKIIEDDASEMVQSIEEPKAVESLPVQSNGSLFN